jgi:quercetin dioxygenase-like cupin family protein
MSGRGQEPAEASSAELHRWEDLDFEELSPRLFRKMVSGENAMVTQVLLKQGAQVPWHDHHNEQFSYVLSGVLRFQFREATERTIEVGAGEMIHIPPAVPHRVEALEDSLTIDIFSPPRQDWLDGADDYLKKS